MIRIVQIACVALLALVLYGVRVGFEHLFDWGGPGFVDGFIVGVLMCFAVYGLICWIDPSSRPRGSSADK
jgi:hypothetical protein